MMSPNFKQTDIGPIPVDWEVDKISSWASVQYGKANPKTEGIIPLIGSGGIFGFTAQPLVKYPTIIIGRKGTAGSVQLFYIPTYPTDTTFYLKWKNETPPIEILFNSFLLRPMSGLHSKTTMPSLLRSDVENYLFSLPPLPEQHKIAHILSKIQQAVEKQEQIIKTTQELKKALMQKLLTEGINNEPQKQTEIGLLPQSWGVVAIKDVVEETETRNPSLIPYKSVKYIDVSSVSNETFTIVNHQFIKGIEAPGRARKVVKKGDVIFATIRPTLKRIAKISSLFDDEYCSTAFCVLRGKSDILDSDFLFQYIQTDSFIERIGKLQSGASYPAVRDDNVKEMLIPFPHFNEQKKISKVLTSLDTKLEFHNKNKTQLQDLFKTMLNQLMSGQLRVKDIDLSAVADLKVPSREGI